MDKISKLKQKNFIQPCKEKKYMKQPIQKKENMIQSEKTKENNIIIPKKMKLY